MAACAWNCLADSERIHQVFHRCQQRLFSLWGGAAYLLPSGRHSPFRHWNRHWDQLAVQSQARPPELQYSSPATWTGSCLRRCMSAFSFQSVRCCASQTHNKRQEPLTLFIAGLIVQEHSKLANRPGEAARHICHCPDGPVFKSRSDDRCFVDAGSTVLSRKIV